MFQNYYILCVLDTIALKFSIALYKLAAMIFAVSLIVIYVTSVENDPLLYER
jgi:hypothetical protein